MKRDSLLRKIFRGLFIRKAFIFFFIAILQCPAIVYAQENKSPQTENDLKKEAAKDFEKDDFIDACLLYSQLLSLHPRDPNYNYRFGACLLFTKADKSKPIDYLQSAIKQPTVENLAYYYLGKALHLNYRFDEAINAYKKFAQIATPSELKKYSVDHLIEMCINGKTLLASLHGLDVLDKKELNLADFIAGYDMGANGGVLIAEPDIFKTKLDKQDKNSNLMYLTPDRSKGFFSSYGDIQTGGKNIYMVKRKPDGTWGTPQNLGDIINTGYDEDYPVYDAPRQTLYFSSKGHNSMGGYDIFSSVYDASYNTWSKPINLDFPINATGDDILFVPDSTGQTAYFSSTRSSPQGKIDVYKIILHLHPTESVVFAGAASTDNGKTPILCTITVKDSSTHRVIGVYTSSSINGKYYFSLPKGENYKFNIEAANHPSKSISIALPFNYNGNTIRQDIRFDASGNLLVQNQPTEIPSDTDYVNYIKQQAQMDVNVNPDSVANLLAKNGHAYMNSVEDSLKHADNSSPSNNSTSTIKPLPAATVQNNTNNPVPTNTESPAQLAQDEQVLNTNAEKATDYASDKMEDAAQKYAQAKSILNGSLKNGISPANPDSVTAAQNLLSQSNLSEEKGMEAYQLAIEDKNEAAAKQVEINKSGNVNPTSNTSNSKTTISAGDLIRMQAQQVKEDSLEVVKNNDELTQEISGLQQESKSFIAQAGQTTNADQKVALLQQSDDLSKSREEKRGEIEGNNQALQQLHYEHSWLIAKAHKADSISMPSSNSGKNNTTGNAASKPALQKEIDAYAAANNYSSDSTENVANNNNPNAVANNNGKQNHPLHHHKIVVHHTSTSGHIATNAPNNNTAPTQNTQIANNSSVVTAQANNTPAINPQSNSTVITNQNSQVSNNNPVTTTSLPTTTSSSQSNSTINSTQNSQVVNNSSTVSSINGTTNTTTSSTPIVTTAPPPIAPASDATLDSLANANTVSRPKSIPDNNSSSITTVQYIDATAESLNQKSLNYFSAAAVLYTKSQEYRNIAQNAQGSNEVALNRKADSTDNLIAQLNLKGDESLTEAYYQQYKVTAKQIPNINIQSAKAQGMLRAADSSYKKSLYEKQTADNIPDRSTKHAYIEFAKQDASAAIVKQQEAIYAYYQLDSVQIVAKGRSSSRFNYANFLKNQEIEISGSLTTSNTSSVNPANKTIQNTPVENGISNATNAIASTNTEKQNTENTQPLNSVNSSNNITATPPLPTASNQPVATNNTNGNPSENVTPSVPQNTETNNNTVSSTNTEPVSTTENSNIFKNADKPAYSASNPIPMDQSFPPGVIFNIQVAAFINPIPQNLFHGFQPIMATRAPNGYIRYTTGLFRAFDSAKVAVKKIRSIGYPDAFIVAYYNGKRITLQAAIAKLGIPNAASGAFATQNIGTTATTNNISGTSQSDNTDLIPNSEVVVMGENTIVPSQKELIDERKRTQKAIKDSIPPDAPLMDNVKGLVFTVQVGSFAKRKGFIRLRKIKHLYTRVDVNGNIKYNSGTYSNPVDAATARDIIREHTEVKDAFVAAYYNGKRITVKRAIELLNKVSPKPTTIP